MTDKIQEELKIKNHTFKLEIYPRLDGQEDITWEIFPHDYTAALYAFSNKDKLNKLIKEKHIYEPRKNNAKNNI